MKRHIGLSVVVVLLTIADGALKMLLVRHDSSNWALPTGAPQYNEPLQDAAERVVRELLGKDVKYLEQLYTFGSAIPPEDGQRAVEVAYYGLVPAVLLELGQQHDPASINWFAVAQPPRLITEHRQVVQVAQDRLCGKLAYTAVGFELLADTFTLAELHKLYEVILGKQIDKRNFRKKVLGLNVLQEIGVGAIVQKGRGRPAKRYRFRQEVFQSIDTKRDIFQF
jgi:8-oxo-dGTP diphosphatase